MARDVELRLDLIPPTDLELLRRCATAVGLGRATVKRFRRFGRSGSELYLLSDTDEARPDVYVVKIGERADIEVEAELTGAASHWVDAPNRDEVFPVYDTERGALCVTYKAHGDDVVELEEIHRRAIDGDALAREQLLSNLTATYETLFAKSHRPSPKVHAYTYGDLFGRYQRENHTDRIAQVFDSRNEPLRLQANDVATNPLERKQELLGRPIADVLVGFVHGDLHLSNIVLREDAPALVDFAWSDLDDHACKDFVMVESSLRFMLFPRTVHPAILEEVDSLLSATWDVGSARAVVRELPVSNGRQALEVMLDGVERVRHHADIVGDQFLERDKWHTEYFTCLYLVLAGQQRFDTFPLIRVIANLAEIGERYVWS